MYQVWVLRFLLRKGDWRLNEYWPSSPIQRLACAMAALGTAAGVLLAVKRAFFPEWISMCQDWSRRDQCETFGFKLTTGATTFHRSETVRWDLAPPTASIPNCHESEVNSDSKSPAVDQWTTFRRPLAGAAYRKLKRKRITFSWGSRLPKIKTTAKNMQPRFYRNALVPPRSHFPILRWSWLRPDKCVGRAACREGTSRRQVLTNY